MTINLFSQTNYEYIDGNNNIYIITELLITYKPVTKAESSSGNYSGGKPKEIEITSEEFKKLEKLFSRALSAKKEQRTNRIMQSGMLVHNISKIMSRKVILKPDSDCKTKIETNLKNLLK